MFEEGCTTFSVFFLGCHHVHSGQAVGVVAVAKRPFSGLAILPVYVVLGVFTGKPNSKSADLFGAIFALVFHINGAVLREKVGQHFCQRRDVRRTSFQQLSLVSQRLRCTSRNNTSRCNEVHIVPSRRGGEQIDEETFLVSGLKSQP